MYVLTTSQRKSLGHRVIIPLRTINEMSSSETQTLPVRRGVSNPTRPLDHLYDPTYTSSPRDHARLNTRATGGISVREILCFEGSERGEKYHSRTRTDPAHQKGVCSVNFLIEIGPRSSSESGLLVVPQKAKPSCMLSLVDSPQIRIRTAPQQVTLPNDGSMFSELKNQPRATVVLRPDATIPASLGREYNEASRTARAEADYGNVDPRGRDFTMFRGQPAVTSVQAQMSQSMLLKLSDLPVLQTQASASTGRTRTVAVQTDYRFVLVVVVVVVVVLVCKKC
jgi:hypothetical protein